MDSLAIVASSAGEQVDVIVVEQEDAEKKEWLAQVSKKNSMDSSNGSAIRSCLSSSPRRTLQEQNSSCPSALDQRGHKWVGEEQMANKLLEEGMSGATTLATAAAAAAAAAPPPSAVEKKSVLLDGTDEVEALLKDADAAADFGKCVSPETIMSNVEALLSGEEQTKSPASEKTEADVEALLNGKKVTGSASAIEAPSFDEAKKPLVLQSDDEVADDDPNNLEVEYQNSSPTFESDLSSFDIGAYMKSDDAVSTAGKSKECSGRLSVDSLANSSAPMDFSTYSKAEDLLSIATDIPACIPEVVEAAATPTPKKTSSPPRERDLGPMDFSAYSKQEDMVSVTTADIPSSFACIQEVVEVGSTPKSSSPHQQRDLAELATPKASKNQTAPWVKQAIRAVVVEAEEQAAIAATVTAPSCLSKESDLDDDNVSIKAVEAAEVALQKAAQERAVAEQWTTMEPSTEVELASTVDTISTMDTLEAMTDKKIEEEEKAAALKAELEAEQKIVEEVMVAEMKAVEDIWNVVEPSTEVELASTVDTTGTIDTAERLLQKEDSALDSTTLETKATIDITEPIASVKEAAAALESIAAAASAVLGAQENIAPVKKKTKREIRLDFLFARKGMSVMEHARKNKLKFQKAKEELLADGFVETLLDKEMADDKENEPRSNRSPMDDEENEQPRANRSLMDDEEEEEVAENIAVVENYIAAEVEDNVVAMVEDNNIAVTEDNIAAVEEPIPKVEETPPKEAEKEEEEETPTVTEMSEFADKTMVTTSMMSDHTDRAVREQAKNCGTAQCDEVVRVPTCEQPPEGGLDKEQHNMTEPVTTGCLEACFIL